MVIILLHHEGGISDSRGYLEPSNGQVMFPNSADMVHGEYIDIWAILNE